MKEEKKKNKGKSFLETVREIDEKERLMNEAAEEKRREILDEKKKKEREEYDKRIRQEKIELMRLKQGVITESEIICEKNEEKKKLSFLKKIGNFLYHSKWWLLITVFIVGVMIFLVVDYVTTVKPDMIVMVLTDDPTLQGTNGELSEYLEQFVDDRNGDGKVSVDVYPIAVNDHISTADYYTGDMTKLASQFQLADAIMVISDAVADEVILADETLVNLEELFPDNKNVRGNGFYIRNTDFMENIGHEDVVLDRDIYIGLRAVTKTYDSLEKMQENYDYAYSVLEKIIEDLPYEQKNRTLTPESQADMEGGMQ